MREHQEGEPRARCRGRFHVLPAPADALVWVVWDWTDPTPGVEMNSEAYRVLALGIWVDEYEVDSEGVARYSHETSTGKKFERSCVKFPAWSDHIKADDAMEFLDLYVLVMADWENAWVLMNTNGFWSKERAEEQLKTVAARQAAAAAADARTKGGAVGT